MASTYSSNLKLQLMGTGDNAGTWGDVTNVNLGTALEESIAGTVDVAFSSSDITLTLTDDNTAQAARNMRLNLTGTSGGARNLIVPAIEKMYVVNNGLADACTVKVSGQTGVSVPAGKTTLLFNNGTDIVNAINALAGLTTTDNINFGDNDRAIFGAGSDLQIHHDGSNSFIQDAGTGSLFVQATNLILKSNGTGENYMRGIENGTVELYHNGVKKIETTATGIDVTGTVVSDGLTVASDSTYAIDASRVGAGNTTLRITGGSTAGNDAVLRADIANTTGSTGVYFGDSDTNGIGRIMYEHNGDYMRFYTSSTEKMRITSAGNVGIGTTSPAVDLDIENSDTAIIQLKDTGDTRSGAIKVRNGDLTLVNGIGVSGAGTERAKIVLSDNSFMSFDTGATERMRINSSGNVGIGTTSPSTNLQIKANDNLTTTFPLRITNNAGSGYIDFGAYAIDTAAVDLVLKAGGNTSITIDKDNGYVGIGASPAEPLHVIGTVRSSTSSTGDFNFYATSTGGGGYRIYPDDATTANPTWLYQSNSSEDQAWVIGGVEKMRITSTGNVGIGTSSPAAMLHLSGALPRIYLTDTDTSTLSTFSGENGWLTLNAATSRITFSIASSEKMRIVGSNVGIGTASPVKRLTISGASNGNITTLTDAATITPNLDSSDMFTVTLGGNRTLANPSNRDAGQTGSIFIVQDGTGSRTLAWGSYWDFAGGTAPTLSTAAGAVDRVDFIVRTSTSIHAVFTANYS